MKKRFSLFYTALLIALVLCLDAQSWAVCDGSTMSGGGYCVYQSGFGTVGGSTDGVNNDILASNMYPYQQRDTASDLKFWYDKAIAEYNSGYAFRTSLLLFDFTPDSSTPQGRMLLDPKDNYEKEGFVTTDTDADNIPDGCVINGGIGEKLVSARDTFAYNVSIGYPDSTTAKSNLLNSIKALSNIYLIVSDEFLIDALEFRFSSYSVSPGMMDQRLDEQIVLLTKAQLCYSKAVDSFVYGFSKAVGTNIYASDYFDDSVFSLFNLSVERMSMALREKSAKELAKMISPDPIVEGNAKKTSGNILKNVYASTYLLAAALGNKEGTKFLTNGGDRIANALNSLRNQGNIYKEDLNPLGYDNRYVPMQDFSKLYSDASNWYTSAKNSQDTLAAEKRNFDADVNQLKTALYNLAENPGGYKSQLALLTGVSVSDADFSNKVAVAGDDLYDCPIDLSDFDACIQDKTKGILGSKYSQIREAQIRVDQALLKKQNLIEILELENKKQSELISLENKYNSSYKDTLKNYLNNIKDARTVTKTKEKVKGKDTDSKTVTTYSLKNPQLNLDIDKEIKLQKALTDYKIAQINATDEIVIKNYINNLAEIEIEIGLAIQQKNSILADFKKSFKEKDDLAFLYKKAVEQLNYSADLVKEKIPEVRILRSQAALELSRNLNAAVHYAYLAAKTLEYKYLKPLNNVTVLNQTLSIYDLYKAQTAEDVKAFLDNLSAYDSCAWGSVSRTTIKISLAKDILGLTDKYLNPSGTLTASEVSKLRYEKVQSFLSDKIDTSNNSLRYGFSISLNDFYISKWGKYNLKIWWGTAYPPCDPVPTKGIAVNLLTNQTSSITPLVQLFQKGHSTYLDKLKNILEYIPVGEYLNMLSENIDSTTVTKGNFSAYVNGNPDNDSLWDPSFKGRSVASSDWEIVVSDIGDYPIDWSKLSDIVFYIDTMGSTLL